MIFFQNETMPFDVNGIFFFMKLMGYYFQNNYQLKFLTNDKKSENMLKYFYRSTMTCIALKEKKPVVFHKMNSLSLCNGRKFAMAEKRQEMLCFLDTLLEV